MDAIVNALRATEIFQELSPLQITEIARNADRVVFNPGDVIVARDEACDYATLVFDGEAICLRGCDNEPLEDPVGPGAILVEMAMVVDVEAAVTVVARSRVRAVRIHRSALLEQMTEDPEVAELLMDVITGRLRSVSDVLKQIDQGLACVPDPQAQPLPEPKAPNQDKDQIASLVH